jgi:Putative esterase
MRIQSDLYNKSARTETMLVLLAPSKALIEDFHTQGFVAAIRRRRIPIDLILAEADFQLVMDKTVACTLHEQVVLPAIALGYQKIWLAGISLGAFYALYYAAEYAAHLAGIYLMAPYPGTADILAEINAAGGPGLWSCSPDQNDERAWWHWLCREAAAGLWNTPVYLGTGSKDRFLRGQLLLAGLLPVQNVRIIEGSHAWPIWLNLWQDWLDHGPLCAIQQSS